LGQSTADEDGKHDQPPYSAAVAQDQPNGIAPVHPGNSPFPHKLAPNRALMQSGTPEQGTLPWVYGRWMRSEDWKITNDIAK
jgi:hypothetical protein